MCRSTSWQVPIPDYGPVNERSRIARLAGEVDLCVGTLDAKIVFKGLSV